LLATDALVQAIARSAAAIFELAFTIFAPPRSINGLSTKGAAQMISGKRLFSTKTAIVFLAFVFSFLSLSSFARPWKPAPNAMALDYSQIVDNRSGTGKEGVFLWWINPPSIAALLPAGREVFEKYVIIGAVHFHVSAAGVFTFDDIPALDAKSGSTSLTPLNGDAIPPTVAGMLTTFKSSLGQALGSTGQGLRWFVFDAGSLHACDKGGLSVPLADETYTWDTPVPGCPEK